MDQMKFELTKELYTRAISNFATQMGFVLFMFFYYQQGHEIQPEFVAITTVLVLFIIFRYLFNSRMNKKLTSSMEPEDLDKIRNNFSIVVFFLAVFWMVFTAYPIVFLNASITQAVFPFSGMVMSTMGAMGISLRDFWIFLSFQIGVIFFYFVYRSEGNSSMGLQIGLLFSFAIYLLNQQKSVYKLWADFIYARFDQQYLLNGFPGFVCLIRKNKKTFCNELYRRIENENAAVFINQIETAIFDFSKSAQSEMNFETSLMVDQVSQVYQIILQKTAEKLIVVVGLNIQNQKDKEAQIQEQKALLDQSSKMAALGEMSGGIAHEINNPLAVILVTTQKIKKNLDTKFDKESLLQPLVKIEAMVDRIAKIVKSLRAFARDGSQDPFSKVSISSIIDDTLSFCENKFTSAGVTIRKSVANELTLNCRPTEISQVLLNLLNNAFDAMMDSEPGRPKTLSIYALKSENTIRIAVQDTGVGVPEEIRNKILQPFFTTKDVGHGTGLGLSISRSIMLSHNGHLSFDFSTPQQTTVILEFFNQN